MKPRFTKKLCSLLRSFSIAAAGFTFQVHADTLTWKADNAGSADIATVTWTNSSGQDATFQTGDNLIFGNHNEGNVDLKSDITTGNIEFNSSNSSRYWLAGNGHFLGNATITVNMGSGGNDNIVVGGKIFEQFAGNIVLNSGAYFQIGSSGGANVTTNNKISLGSGAIIVNSGARLRLEITGNATDAANRSLETKIILNGGARMEDNNKFGVTIGSGGLEIGSGTATWAGSQNGTNINSGRLVINGVLSGGSDSVFILGGTTSAANSNAVSTVTLANENSYEGVLRVTTTAGSWGNELHLNHSKATQNATVDLQSAGKGSSAYDKAGQASLVLNVSNATVAGLTGTANSLVTSTVASSVLTVNNSADNVYSGKIDDGTGGLTLIKTGTGALTLANAGNTHTGTVIQQGTLKLAEATSAGSNLTITKGGTAEMLSSGSGTYNLDSGITLNIAATGTGTDTNLTGNLNFGGGTLTLDLGWLTSTGNTSPYFTVSGDITFTPDSVTTFSLVGDPSSMSRGTYLFAEANSIQDFDPSRFNFTLANPKYSYMLTKNGTNQIILTITDNDNLLVWTAGNGIWDTTSTNWEKSTNPGTPEAYYADASVQFVDRGQDITVDVAAVTSPVSMELANDEDTYTFSGSGSFSGDFAILKTGSGTAIFDLDNTGYNGQISLQNGILIAKQANSLGTAHILFDGGTLGLATNITLSSVDVGTDQNANFLVDNGDRVVASFSTSTSSALLSNSIYKTGAGELVLRADAETTYTSSLIAAEGRLTIDTSNGSVTMGATSSFSGELGKTGSNDLTISLEAYNASSGTLYIDQGRLNISNDGNYSSNVNIVLADGAGMYVNGSGATFSNKNSTLTMGQGSYLHLYNGSSSNKSFWMNINLAGGSASDAAASVIQGFRWGENTINSLITGNGNLLYLSEVNNNDLRYRSGTWMNNSYVGTTTMKLKGLRLMTDGTALTDNMTWTPWGDASNDVYIGSRDNSVANSTVVSFAENYNSNTAYSERYAVTKTQGLNFTIAANSINLTANNYNTTLSLFGTLDASGEKSLARIHLPGMVTANKTGTGVITIRSATYLGLEGGLGGSGDLSIILDGPTVANNELALIGDNSGYTGNLTVSTTGNIILGSSTNKAFGGGLTTGGANLTINDGGQTIANNLGMGSGSFIFNSSALSTSEAALTIGGNLTVATDSTITIDNTGQYLQTDGVYDLLSLNGTLTGSFLTGEAGVTWLNDSRPTDGTYTLNYDSGRLYLMVSGLSAMVWHGADASGNGTWAVNNSGWGNDGSTIFADTLSVSFGDITGSSTASVNISGAVAPSKVEVKNTNTAYTFSGSGSIAGETTTLAKTGSGTLTIGNANTYAGGTTITQGKLIAANATALGNGDVLINGGTLQLSVPLVLQGSLTMASGNIVFDMSGPSGGGPVGGEAGPLGGAGLGSPVTVMTMTDFNMTGGSYTFKVFADGSYQSFASSTNGTFTMLNGSLTIDMSDYADFDGSSFSINTFFQNFSDFDIDYQNVVSLIDASGWTGTVGADGMVTFSVIPEPSTAALFALAAAGLFGRRNRKVEA